MSIVTTYNKSAWLGNYPKHWKLRRIKNIFSEVEDKSTTGNEDLLSVSHYTGVTLKRDSLENEDDFISNAESLEGYKKVAQGDLVINIMLAWNGSLGISPYNGITSPAYCVYRAKENNNPDYFGYLFATNLLKTEFRKKSTGIIDSRLRLYSDKFFSIFSIVPPLTEQNQIVEFIKIQSQKINHFIAKKKQFIALLKEQRQSVINEAVTKGINKKVKLKDSGIKWLGNIPEHWEIRRLRYCGQCQNGLNKGGEFFGSGYPFYGYGDIYNNEILPIEPSGLVMSSVEDRENCSVQEGDVFFTRTSEIVDEIAIASTCFETIEDATFSGFLIRFRPFKDILEKSFSSYYFRCQLLRAYFVKEMNIITRASMSQDLLKNLPILIPPKKEQIEIYQHIKTETATIETAIAKTLKEIELIREYKEAMIAEAVMGKINFSKNKLVKYGRE
ncbi:MAG TPA: restriction endonuclease subunit S [Chitinophagales bacterium]|nr:restriction endonuclease subunit S [Chitinophagales bacterium]